MELVTEFLFIDKSEYVPMFPSLKEGLKCIPMGTEGTGNRLHMSVR